MSRARIVLLGIKGEIRNVSQPPARPTVRPHLSSSICAGSTDVMVESKRTRGCDGGRTVEGPCLAPFACAGRREYAVVVVVVIIIIIVYSHKNKNMQDTGVAF